MVIQIVASGHSCQAKIALDMNITYVDGEFKEGALLSAGLVLPIVYRGCRELLARDGEQKCACQCLFGGFAETNLNRQRVA